MDRKQAIAARLLTARKETGYSQVDVGGMLGISDVAYGAMERGITNIDIPTLERLANILGQSLDWFLGDELPPTEWPKRPVGHVLRELGEAYQSLETVELPIRGQVPAGYPSAEEESIEGYIAVPKGDLGGAGKGCYGLRVAGESLIGDGINSGDIVVVDPDDVCIVNGAIYVVRLGNEVVARHVYSEDTTVRLVASNCECAVMLSVDVEILGRVVLSGQWRKH